MRHPVIISSLEEDFKNLGLVDDSAPAKEESEPVEEGRVARRRASGGRKVKATKRSSSADKRASKQYYMKKGKRRAKSAMGKKRRKLLHKKNVRMGFEDVNVESRNTLRGGKLSSLFEDVNNILSSLDEDRVENAVKSFANVAIIAEMLSDFFEAVLQEGVEDEELSEELSEAVEFFADMSESAAQVATALNEGEDLDVTLDDIEEAFNEQMEHLVEGLELYADLTEDDDCDDDEDEDEDEDEEMEESVSPKSRMRAKLGKR